MPKVTIIVPVYNVEAYLARCLDSLAKQTCRDYEIICINDCSPDNSSKILEEYTRRYQDKLTVLENKRNIGLGKTRERGIRHARGKYILFVDSDDYIRKDFVETYLREMERNPCDIVIGGYTRDVDGKLTGHKVSGSVWSVVTYPIACAKMFRKEFLTEHGLEFSDIRCGEDIYFSLCVFYYGARYRVIDYDGYYYYFNRKSITGSMNYEKNHEEFVSWIFDEFLSKHDIGALSENQRRVIEYAYVSNMVNALITYGHGGGVKRMRKKYDFWMRDMGEKFPDYKRNPYFGIFKPKGETRKIRLGVGVTMLLHKVHLDKLMFYVISLL